MFSHEFIIIMICIFGIFLYFNHKNNLLEKMTDTTTDEIRNIVKEVYDVDIQGIQILNDLSKSLISSDKSTLTIPFQNIILDGNVTVNKNLTVKGVSNHEVINANKDINTKQSITVGNGNGRITTDDTHLWIQTNRNSVRFSNPGVANITGTTQDKDIFGIKNLNVTNDLNVNKAIKGDTVSSNTIMNVGSTLNVNTTRSNNQDIMLIYDAAEKNTDGYLWYNKNNTFGHSKNNLSLFNIRADGTSNFTGNTYFGTGSGRKLGIIASNYNSEQTYFSFYNGDNRTSYLMPTTNGIITASNSFIANGDLALRGKWLKVDDGNMGDGGACLNFGGNRLC